MLTLKKYKLQSNKLFLSPKCTEGHSYKRILINKNHYIRESNFQIYNVFDGFFLRLFMKLLLKVEAPTRYRVKAEKNF
jgi:hypothetical protein